MDIECAGGLEENLLAFIDSDIKGLLIVLERRSVNQITKVTGLAIIYLIRI
jgi:hypothetical protein